MLEIEYNPDYAFELRHEGQKAKESAFHEQSIMHR